MFEKSCTYIEESEKVDRTVAKMFQKTFYNDILIKAKFFMKKRFFVLFNYRDIKRIFTVSFQHFS